MATTGEPQESKTQQDPAVKEAFKLAPYNPCSTQIQEKGLKLLSLTEKDVLFDLGCGDGRFLVTAAQEIPGLKCVGIEIEHTVVSRAVKILESLPEDIRSRVEVREGDVLNVQSSSGSVCGKSAIRDQEVMFGEACRELTLLGDATSIFVFILPKGIVKLMPILEAVVERRKQEKKTLRVLSYMFKIHDWEPTKIGRTDKGNNPIYLYEFPFSLGS